MCKRIIFGIAACLGFAGFAQADFLGSGPVYGGSTQVGATCYVRNIGIQNVKVARIRIFDGAGNNVAPTSNSCGAPGFLLRPGESCNIFASGISNGSAHDCVVRISEEFNKGSIRAVLDIRGPDNVTVLQTMPLR